MIVAGIDPGKTGALFLHDATCGLHECLDVPQIASGPKGKMQPDFARWEREWTPLLFQAEHIFIERVGAMPGQGVTSMFSFGYSAGFMYGLVAASRRPHTFFTPQFWKKAVGLSGSDGAKSRSRASQLLPECARFWPLVKHDGRAEAALIAWAGKQQLEGTAENGEGRSIGQRDRARPPSVARTRKHTKGRGCSRS